MIVHGCAALARETRHRRVLANGFAFHRSEWMSSGEGPGLAPTVFLVEQPAHSVLAAHFHAHDQFQVIQAGAGRLGSHTVGPGSVHFAGAFTGYGPLVAGAEGISYFTIRAAFETGATFLPVDRDKLRRGPKRHAMGPVHAPLGGDALRALPAASRVQLIAAQNGLQAYALLLPPLARFEVDEPAGAGQFQLVLAGTLVTPQRGLQLWESRYLSPGEDAGGCRAGENGLQLLVLHMPARAAEYADV